VASSQTFNATIENSVSRKKKKTDDEDEPIDADPNATLNKFKFVAPKQDEDEDMVNQTLDSLAHFTNLENIIIPQA
jgi:hypothetical protein